MVEFRVSLSVEGKGLGVTFINKFLAVNKFFYTLAKIAKGGV